ncbi:MAG: M28 family peptidase [Candidatus Wallbacteria bacterium]|nr:M28 family peptidase [Candidatus Wallbacteria bacterium]
MALGLWFCAALPGWCAQPIAGELAGRLQRHVRTLAVDIGERSLARKGSLQRTASYVESCWKALGLVVATQPVPIGRTVVENVECRLPGDVPGREVVLIGAHYDTVRGCPGADDNASGIAALLELTRLLAASPRPLPVRFVAFTQEEKLLLTGHLGSRTYARSARERGDRIRLMLSLDTLGFYTDAPLSQRYPFPAGGRSRTGDFLGFITRTQDERWLERVCALASSAGQLPVEGIAASEELDGIAWSDHASFWDQGYSALMVTDTAMFRNPSYHHPADTPDTLDFARLARAVRLLAQVVEAVASPAPASR